MRTLLLTPELFNAEAGIARIMRLYLKALCEIAGTGDTVDSVALNDAEPADARYARYTGPALRRAYGCGRSKRTFIRRTLRLVWRNDRALCGHLHQLPILWFARLLKPGFEYFLIAHGIDVWRPYTFLETRALLGARRILCISDYTRRQMLRFCPALDPERLVVVPNTLDPYFTPGADRALSAAPMGYPRILTVSRLTSVDMYKGVDTLIEALPLVRRDFPSARLRIVGGGDDRPRLEAIVDSLGLAGAVDFRGIVDDDTLRAEYEACDLFALPSRKEGFGLVFLEAMTYGKPCLGARAGGIPEVITAATGALAEYGNIPDIAAGLTDLARYPRDATAVRQHAATFDFPTFRQRLAAALA